MASRGIVLAAICIAYLLITMDYSIINVSLQTIQEVLRASNPQLQWAVNSYEIPYAALVLPAGSLADRYGRKRILLGGLALFGLASCGIATSASPDQVIFWRTLMGVGASAVPATTLAIIKDIYKPSEQARVLGVWAAMGGASAAVGPILGGALVQGLAWWSAFLGTVPIVALCMFVLWRYAPESAVSTSPRLDWPGTALIAAGLGTLAFGIIQVGQTDEWLAPGTLGTMTLGVMLITALAVVELRRESPMLHASLLKNRAFASGTVTISLAYFALSGGTFLLVFYMQLIQRSSPLELGLAMLPLAAGAVAGSLVSEPALRRVGPRAAIAIGTILSIVAFVSFATFDVDSPLILVEAGFLTLGVGMGLLLGCTTPLSLSAIPTSASAAGAGLSNMIRAMSSIMGIAVLGAVYSLIYQANIRGRFGIQFKSLPVGSDESLSQTLTALHDSPLPHTGVGKLVSIVTEAQGSFITAYDLANWVAVAALSVGLLLSIALVPARLPDHTDMPTSKDARTPSSTTRG